MQAEAADLRQQADELQAQMTELRARAEQLQPQVVQEVEVQVKVRPRSTKHAVPGELCAAAEKGDADAVRSLLRRDADVNEVDDKVRETVFGGQGMQWWHVACDQVVQQGQ